MLKDRLIAARKMRGMSQQELATAAGFQASAISHYETGSRQPSAENLRHLAGALEVSADYLLELSDKNNTGAGVMQRRYDQLGSRDRRLIRAIMKAMGH